MKNNKPIQLTEQDLHFLVEDAVRNILKENGMEEGALWNAFKQKGQQIGQNIGNMARNMQQTYQTGKQNTKLQQYANNLIAQVNNFVEMASQFPDMAELVKASQNYETQVRNIMQNSNDNLANISARTFSTKRY